MTKKFEKRVQRMMGRAAAALLCALTFTAVLPAAPAYARPKRNTSAQADKERMQDAAGMVQAAFDQKDMDALVPRRDACIIAARRALQDMREE